MNLRIPLLIACLFLSFGCRKPSIPAPAAPPTASGLPASQLNHPEGGSLPVAQVKYFKGSIGSSLDLQMKLLRTGDQLAGSYFYQHVGTRTDVRGNHDTDGSLTLVEFAPRAKQTGVFKGVWQVDAQDGLVTLAGNWSKPPNEK